jgi:hypothetical protein
MTTQVPDQFDRPLPAALQERARAPEDAGWKPHFVRQLPGALHQARWECPHIARIGSEVNVRYSIDKRRRLIFMTAEGRVTFDDLRAHQDRLLADPEFDKSFDQLIDATRVTKIDVSADGVRTLAQRHIFSFKSRRALVATKPDIFGVGRMMEIYQEDAGHTELEVFYSMDEALKWLEKVESEEEKYLTG